MAKIALGQRPETFQHTVNFPMLDGKQGSIEVAYIYRTRTQFGEFADEIRSQVKAQYEADLDRIKAVAAKGEHVPELTQAEIISREGATNVDYVMRCVKGWNLDVPFDRAAVVQLADEVPAAVTAIIAAYRDAVTEGRLGN
jgi:hypothetical protein